MSGNTRGRLAALAAAWVGFPTAGVQVPVSVSFSPMDGAERWVRSFAGRSFSSVQSPGRGRNAHLLVERFGVASFALALLVENDRLILMPRRWSLFGVPMPRFLLPAGLSFETERDGRFHFDVEISAPFIGLIVAYRGMLSPDLE